MRLTPTGNKANLVTKICITICTRQRPEMLENCVQSLIPQIESADRGDQILVVENDTTPIIEPLIDRLKKEHPAITLIYKHEPNLGIPIARNTCLETALESGCDWLAYIDDDELAEPGWLEAMRRGAKELDVEVITGPVRPLLETEPPAWLKIPKLKPRIRGKRRETAATNNTLINLAWMKTEGKDLRFDEQFRFTGGEDIDFFFHLTDRGGRICWIDDAIVSEVYTNDRMQIGWQLKRSKRVQANNYLIHKKRGGRLYSIGRTAPKIFGRGLRGLVFLTASPALYIINKKRSAEMAVEGLIALAASWGAIEGMTGKSQNIYQKTIGR